MQLNLFRIAMQPLNEETDPRSATGYSGKEQNIENKTPTKDLIILSALITIINLFDEQFEREKNIYFFFSIFNLKTKWKFCCIRFIRMQ